MVNCKQTPHTFEKTWVVRPTPFLSRKCRIETGFQSVAVASLKEKSRATLVGWEP